ncbi:FAD binding domain-containing protein [Cordyceps javanica]|uniref:FAD binding domain-containing protein n=1 Tax=Cordyceps javanica TaxID=43265 RepID=A0A545V4R5_9HYPO|nr:FAD binding domain-containing protein [Cordyceps javanica]TQW07966.1 FAD binding domain-containing protein [Cordyceps javanica]
MASETSTENSPLRIAIIGAGIGGLVLAQLLKNDARYSVTVYERGPAEGAGNSLVGFRILVVPEIFQRLRDQVEPQVQELLANAVGVPKMHGNRACFMDQHCRVKYRADNQAARSAISISRWKLRTALLHGLGNSVAFNMQFCSYDQDDDQVKVTFSNGQTVACDVLVGADGAGSRVRKQLLPDSTRRDTGVTIIYFKAPLTPETEAMIPWGSGGLVLTPRQSMVISYFKNPKKPYGPYDLQKIDPEDSFLMIGLGCYTNEFHNKTKSPDQMTAEELKDECLSRARDWHPLLKSLIAITVPSSVFISYLRTQELITPWHTGRVTILGDAAHRYGFLMRLCLSEPNQFLGGSMTPYLGRGATSAIFDAISLAESLKSEDGCLTDRLGQYEKLMLDSGFTAAKNSMFIHNLVFPAGNSPWFARFRNLALCIADWFLPHPKNVDEKFPVTYSLEPKNNLAARF